MLFYNKNAIGLIYQHDSSVLVFLFVVDPGAGASAVQGGPPVQGGVDLLEQRSAFCLQHGGPSAQKWDGALQLF